MQQLTAVSVSTEMQVVDCRGFDETTINLFLAAGASPYHETEVRKLADAIDHEVSIKPSSCRTCS